MNTNTEEIKDLLREIIEHAQRAQDTTAALVAQRMLNDPFGLGEADHHYILTLLERYDIGSSTSPQ